MEYSEPCGRPPSKAWNKLHHAWNHTGAAIGVVAALISIVSFFGIHPATQEETKKPVKSAETKHPDIEPKKLVAGTSVQPLQPKGIGTFHFEGGFDAGEPMISKAALVASNDPSRVTLLRPNEKEEILEDTKVAAPAETNQAVNIWRKGKQFLRGIKLTSSEPNLRLSAEGAQPIDVPMDADGRLKVNVVWPTNKVFTTAEYVGPVQIGKLILNGGVFIAGAGASQADNTLPSHFSLTIPKPGEVLSTFKGEFRYPRRSNQRRYVVVQAYVTQDEPVATWSAEFNQFGPTVIRNGQGGIFDRGLSSLRIIYSADPQ